MAKHYLLVGVLIICTIIGCKKNEDPIQVNQHHWSELGGPNNSTFNGFIRSIVPDKIGNIYVIGNFLNSAGYPYVAKWNGSSWVELPNDPSLQGCAYNCIVVDNHNTLYAAVSGGINEDFVLKWDGIAWIKLGNSFDDGVFTLATDSYRNLYAGGNFGLTNTRCIAKWNGTAWLELAPTSLFSNGNFFVSNIIVDGSNNIYAGPAISSSNAALGKWNGVSWSEFGSTLTDQNQFLMSVFVNNRNEFYGFGNYQNTQGKYYLSKWTGSSWIETGGTNSSTFDSNIGAATPDSLGNIYVAGDFKNSNLDYYVAKFNGVKWEETGDNSSFFNDPILTLASDLDNKIYAGGFFKNSNNLCFVAVYK